MTDPILETASSYAARGFTSQAGLPAALTGTWSTRSPMPATIAEVGVVEAGGFIHLIGGTPEGGALEPAPASSVHLMYDPDTDAWEGRAPLPEPASHVGLTHLDGKIYAVGGLSENVHLGPHCQVHAYDPVLDVWNDLAPLPSPRGSIGVAAIRGRVHALGGHSSSTVVEQSPPGGETMRIGVGTVNTHEIFDPGTGRWTEGAPLPGPSRDHMGVATLNGAIHVFGGRVNDYSDMLDRHDVYEPDEDTWTSAAPLPRPRSAGAFTVLQGLIIYAGGECKPGGDPFTPNAFEDVTAYDPSTDRWMELTPLPRARHAFGAAAVNGTAYFVGGSFLCGGGAATDEVLALTLT